MPKNLNNSAFNQFSEMPVLPDKNFSNEIVTGTSIVKFYSLWSYESRMLEDCFKELSDEFRGKAKFIESEVNRNPDLAKKFGVSSIPSIMIFTNGRPTARIEKLCTKRELRNQLERFVKK